MEVLGPTVGVLESAVKYTMQILAYSVDVLGSSVGVVAIDPQPAWQMPLSTGEALVSAMEVLYGVYYGGSKGSAGEMLLLSREVLGSNVRVLGSTMEVLGSTMEVMGWEKLLSTGWVLGSTIEALDLLWRCWDLLWRYGL